MPYICTYEEGCLMGGFPPEQDPWGRCSVVPRSLASSNEWDSRKPMVAGVGRRPPHVHLGEGVYSAFGTNFNQWKGSDGKAWRRVHTSRGGGGDGGKFLQQKN